MYQKALLVFALMVMSALCASGTDVHILYRGDLTIVASKDWTEAECQKLAKIIKECYPLLKKWYGKPSSKSIVTLKKVHGDTSETPWNIKNEKGKIIFPNAGTLNISDQVMQAPIHLVHELAHHFHGRFMIMLGEPPRHQADGGIQLKLHDAVEEGMAQAVTERIRKKLGYQEPQTRVFETSLGFNKSSICYTGRIDCNEGLYPIRMELAAWTINQWEAKHPGFQRRCNEKLYRLGDVVLPITTSQFVAIGERVTPGFKEWFSRQYIFRRNGKPGDYLYVIGDSHRAGIVLYRRTTSAVEVPLVGQEIAISFDFGGKRETRKGKTNDLGLVPIELDQIIRRYRLTVSWGKLTDTFELAP